MKSYRLSMITENQKQLKKAEEVASLIQKVLEIKADPEIRRYEKFPDSYKIELFGRFSSDSNSISEAVELADRIASPWMVQYYRTTGEFELIFNRSAQSRYGRENFNVVRWAHLEVE